MKIESNDFFENRENEIKKFGHHCQKEGYTCFGFIGDKVLVLDCPKNMPVIVLSCPFCGYSVAPPSSTVTTLKE